MSKFSKPGARTPAAPSAADIERVIGGAESDDGRHPQRRTGGGASTHPTPPGDNVKFLMTIGSELAARTDRVRDRLGLSRVALVRLALSRFLDQEGG